MTHEELQRLSYAVMEGIEQGMKNGAAHIAEALAKPKEDVGGVAIHDVSLIELLSACKVLNDVYINETIAGYTVSAKIDMDRLRHAPDAWRTLRKALGMPT